MKLTIHKTAKFIDDLPRNVKDAGVNYVKSDVAAWKDLGDDTNTGLVGSAALYAAAHTNPVTGSIVTNGQKYRLLRELGRNNKRSVINGDALLVSYADAKQMKKYLKESGELEKFKSSRKKLRTLKKEMKRKGVWRDTGILDELKE